MKKKMHKVNGNQESQKKNTKFQAHDLYQMSQPSVASPKEMSANQKLEIMHKLVDELMTYIEYVEMVQSHKDPNYLDMDAVARKVGIPSKKELHAFLHNRAGLHDITEIKEPLTSAGAALYRAASLIKVDKKNDTRH